MHESDGTPEAQDNQELREVAQHIDEALVLEVAFEPADLMAASLFGLDDAALRQIIALTLARAGIAEPVEISLLVTSDEGLRDLNREYRGRDEVTDVLSFPLLDVPIVDAPDEQRWQRAADDELEPDVAAENEELFDDLDAEDAIAAAAGDEDVPNGDYDAPGREPDEMPFLTPEDEGPLHLGDIAVSRDAIQRQAAQAGHRPAWELAYLLSHGVLHLIGYDDHTDAGYAAMVAHQERVLALAGITR